MGLSSLAAILNRLLASLGLHVTGSGLLYGGGGLLLSLSMLLAGGLGAIAALGARHWPTAEGIVLSARTYLRRSSDGDEYQPEITYRYQVGDQTYVGNRLVFGARHYRVDKVAARKTVARYPAGSTVRVYYKPGKPERAVLEPRYAPAGLLIFLGLLFSVLSAFGLFVLP